MQRLALCLFLSLSALATSAFAKVDLADLVVGYEVSEKDFIYPMKAISGYGELYLNRFEVHISANCKGFITLGKNAIYCAPKGNQAKKFAFATFGSRRVESDSHWTAIFLIYDRNRVTLKAKPNRPTEGFEYTLDIRD